MNMNIEILYEYNNMIYNVIGSQELHNLLQSDSAFFEQYILSKGTNLEMQVSQDTQDEAWTWTKANILIFLNCIEKRKFDLRNPKIKKKNVWKDIREEMAKQGLKNIDEAMIERKFRNMKGTYKTIKDNKKKTSTGRGQIKWDYYDAMENIFQEDKTINTDHTISSFTKSSCVTNSSVVTTLSTSTMEQPNAFNLVNARVNDTILDDITNETSDVETIQTPKSVNSLKRKKQDRGKQLYGLRKKQIEVEENRVREIELLRQAIEENNKIQTERNTLFKLWLEKKMRPCSVYNDVLSQR